MDQTYYDIRVTAGHAADAKGIRYPNYTVPDPAAYRAYESGLKRLAEVPEGMVGRTQRGLDGKPLFVDSDGKPGGMPMLRKGITFPRGTSIELKGVSESYLTLVRANHTITVDVIGQSTTGPTPNTEPASGTEPVLRRKA